MNWTKSEASNQLSVETQTELCLYKKVPLINFPHKNLNNITGNNAYAKHHYGVKPDNQQWVLNKFVQ